MVFAAAISVEKKSLSLADFNLIEDTLMSFGLPITIPRVIKTTKIVEHMDFDKKRKMGKINFVLLKSIGTCLLEDRLTKSYLLKLVKIFQR